MIPARFIEDWSAERCETCGRPSGDAGPVIRAANSVLDRTGLHSSVAVQVSRAPDVSLSNLSLDELIEDAEKNLDQLRELKSRETQRLLDAPLQIDGEVVPPLGPDEGEV